MPELPEVETVCRGLAECLPGQTITRFQKSGKKLRLPFPANLQDIRNINITAVSRRAKYILIHFKNGMTMIVHLGMSGRMVVHAAKEKHLPEKHDHLVLNLDNGATVVFNDPRRFGLVALTGTNDLPYHKLFNHLGLEPFDKKFSAAYLAEKLKDKNIAIKLAIMDQKMVVGVGNIYASEALFEARIDPARKAKTLGSKETKKLVAAIRRVLQKAIKAGGSSLRDYVQATGELGYFQHHWSVYDKVGQKCRGCTCNVLKTGGVKRMIQGGRSSFYCPRLQK